MDRISPDGEAYFLGVVFSLADIALWPWWHRFQSIGRFFRDLHIPKGGAYDRLHAWGDACDRRLSVRRTIVNQQRLIENYSSYADASATSTVAQTVAKL